ncbi:hypothetical protein BU16DRAFT_201655 [Lophium mytilinum]|uniref:Uncharacterized protein n=1 Tax=Lophium mytilinum TaxID=390894 RepID=A0A6A6RDL2_9PEZI|nr:hypothetical protein BU16DRAFT_201655 [Lophium mytilinum]
MPDPAVRDAVLEKMKYFVWSTIMSSPCFEFLSLCHFTPGKSCLVTREIRANAVDGHDGVQKRAFATRVFPCRTSAFAPPSMQLNRGGPTAARACGQDSSGRPASQAPLHHQPEKASRGSIPLTGLLYSQAGCSNRQYAITLFCGLFQPSSPSQPVRPLAFPTSLGPVDSIVG